MGACFCTGRCRETGVCPNTWDWNEGDRAAAQGKVKFPPTNVIKDRVFSDVPPSLRIERLEREVAALKKTQTELVNTLSEVYAHPAATPPIIARASGVLRHFGFPLPSRWVLDH